MLEAIQALLTTTSFFQVIQQLMLVSPTDLVMIYLLSKPVFVIAAVGAVISGRARGDAHYLHFQGCDRFLSSEVE